MMRQRGTALLMAMLTVALVATLASAALWRQWRNIEIQGAESQRSQAGWVLDGAMDWARLIMREDARSGGPDHLAEPWAIGLREARLSSFLAVDGLTDDGSQEAFLSGQISDAQGRMNFANLIADGKISEPDREAFVRLFELLGLDDKDFTTVVDQLLLSVVGVAEADTTRQVPLRPRRWEELQWLGLSPGSMVVLAAHAVMLPTRTPVNLNTATAEVIAATLPSGDLADARKLIEARTRAPFRSLADVQKLLDAKAPALDANRFSIASRYFEVRGQLRMNETVFEQRALLLRNGLDVSLVWREYGALRGGAAVAR